MTARRSRRKGFTILEVAIASIILALLIGVAMATFNDTDSTVGESMVIGDLVIQANHAKDLVAREIRGGGNFSVNASFDRLTYRACVGYDFAAGGPEYGAVRQLRFVAGETGNDSDDDGDGLVDEGILELREDRNGDGDVDDSNELLMDLRGNFAEDPTDPANPNNPGFRVTFPSGALSPGTADREVRVRLALASRLPRRGDVHVEVREFRVGIRNKETTP